MPQHQKRLPCQHRDDDTVHISVKLRSISRFPDSLRRPGAPLGSRHDRGRRQCRCYHWRGWRHPASSPRPRSAPPTLGRSIAQVRSIDNSTSAPRRVPTAARPSHHLIGRILHLRRPCGRRGTNRRTRGRRATSAFALRGLTSLGGLVARWEATGTTRDEGCCPRAAALALLSRGRQTKETRQFEMTKSNF